MATTPPNPEQSPQPPPIALYDKGSREEEAELTLKHTTVTAPVAWTIVLLFLLTIFSELVLQHVMLALHGTEPAVYKIGQILPTRVDLREASAGGFLGYWNLLGRTPEIKKFETQLEHSSVISNLVMPPTQEVLTGIGGAGNEKAYRGRGQWLFYRPEVDALTAGPFLDPAALQHRWRSEGVASDPRPAILRFRDQLRARGIELIVMPVPSKPMIQPAMFSERFEGMDGALENPSYAEFRADLIKAGIHTLDITDLMLARKGNPFVYPPPQSPFLETDTHWRPETMESAALELKMLIANLVKLDGPARAYRFSESRATNLGDIAVMFKLQPGQTIFAKQTVPIHPVVDASGAAWEPDESAQVLLLGDSYTNIYSVAGMGWGAGAGLAEQLAFELGRPVDRISRNDAGSWSTRQMLAAELARGHDRLAGKKVVVWEFAIRELTVGDWKLIDLKAAPATAPAATVPAGAIVAEAELLSDPPAISVNDPYKDAVVAYKFKVRKIVSGSYDHDEILAVMPIMRDKQLLAPAQWQKGAVYRLTLIREAPKETETWKRLDDTNEYDLPELWVTDGHPQ